MNSLSRGSNLALKLRLGNFTRQVQSNASLLENCTELTNRNPRNLEFMRIAGKPAGYHLENPGNEYWYKLYIEVSQKHIDAGVKHFKNGPVVTVSTREWALKKQLYKTLNVAAFTNIAKLLAHRCLESGITVVRCDLYSKTSPRYVAFLDGIRANGIILNEPPQYINPLPWDRKWMIKPWTVEG